MKDQLKHRVEHSRPDWDQYETNLEELWGNIEAQLDEKEKTSQSPRTWLKIAASFAILFVISWGLVSVLRSGDDTEELYALHDISPELAETEYYYASQISEKLQMIHTSDADVDNLVKEDLTLLDSAYYELQLDLMDNADNEEVINAMIQNYRIKLQILEKVLDEIRTKESNESPNEIII